MSIYLKYGNRYEVRPDGSIEALEKLPKGVYYIEQNDDRFYLEKRQEFALPAKIYGSQIRKAERIVNTFMTKTSNMGVLLSGCKGSGKTLLAEQVSDLLLKQDVPILIVAHQYNTGDLGNFLKSITERCCVLLDEFEKLFDEDGNYSQSQSGLLTLFDGLIQGNKLFVLTTNRIDGINEYLRNRPGRVYYCFEFHGAGDDVVEQYCADNLINKEWTSQVKGIKNTLNNSFSFDVLKAVVEESNRYNEEPFECVRALNVTPESSYEVYSGKIYKKGQPIIEGPKGREEEVGIEEEYKLNILKEFNAGYHRWNAKDGKWIYKKAELGPHCLRSKTDNTLTYETGGLTFTFTKVPDSDQHWAAYCAKFERKKVSDINLLEEGMTAMEDYGKSSVTVGMTDKHRAGISMKRVEKFIVDAII
ncbi:MAG: ATP-binding protein [Methanomassiliicoccaceae archaeon]|nr:ATP-binding protein [Methanomassiliicoccaceae archaeon]